MPEKDFEKTKPLESEQCLGNFHQEFLDLSVSSSCSHSLFTQFEPLQLSLDVIRSNLLPKAELASGWIKLLRVWPRTCSLHVMFNG